MQLLARMALEGIRWLSVELMLVAPLLPYLLVRLSLYSQPSHPRRGVNAIAMPVDVM